MVAKSFGRAGAAMLLFLAAFVVGPSSRGALLGPPALQASESRAFDRACESYYRQGNDPEVPDFAAFNFCECLALQYENSGLGFDALEFFARTLSDDLTTFIHEYPEGEAWMEQSFQADVMCKSG